MTDYTVSAGVTSGGITLNSGDTLTVLAGGAASDITVNGGGTETVQAGGSTTATIVRAGGVLQVDGGTALDTTVSAKGQIQLENGGVGSGTTIVFGGVDDVFAGGTAISTTVNNSSVEIVWSGGTASDTIVQAGGTVIDVPGGTAVSPTINGGGAEITTGFVVLLPNGGVDAVPPGTAATLEVLAGTPAFVLSGGIVYSAGVDTGAELDVDSGGLGSAITVFASGALGVYAGGTVTSSLVVGGGLEEVFSGGAIVSGAATSGGHIFLNGGSGNLLLVSGAGSELLVGSASTATQITDQSGGVVLVQSGGQAITTEVFPGAELIVSGGGGAEIAYINSGAGAFVLSGGLLSSFYVSSGGNVVLSGGESDFATIAFGGTEVISSGGLAINSDVGGNLLISAGGTAEQALATGSGNIFVQSGGVAASIEVAAGGYAAVSSGGAISGLLLIGVPLVAATISGGGTLIALSGATISGGILFGGPGGEYVTTNTTALTTISSFAMGDTIVAAALPFLGAGSATLDSSDLLTITQGGNSFSAQFDASLTGDTLAWTADPIAGTDIELIPTVISLTAPQTANSLQLFDTQILDVNSGTAANDTNVSSGATVNIFNAGSTYFTILHNGGTQYIFSGGIASATAALGGLEVVSSGGVATGSVIYNAATQTVLSGGLATGTILGQFGTPGGTEQVANGGTVIGAIVNAGGTLVVSPGDIVSAPTIDNGGFEVIVSGATVSGETVNAGASVVISSGGVLVDPMVSAGLLFVSNGATVVSPDTAAAGYVVVLPGGIISGPVASGANVISTGAILLQNGNVVDFAPELDGLSIPFQGTPEYVLPGGVTDASRVFNGGAEYVLGGVADVTSVSSSGALFVGAGGTANDTIVDALGQVVVASGGVLSGGVTFAGSGGSLVISNAGGAGTPLRGFNDTDTIDAAALPFVAAGSGTLNSGFALTINEGAASFVAQFDSSDSFATFGWSADGSGGTDIKVLFDTLFVSGAGVVSSGVVLSAGANIDVYSGGTTSDTVLNAGANEYVSAGGTAIATNLAYQGNQYIYSGGVATGTIFNQGTQTVESGAVDSGTTIYNGSEFLSSGGTAVNDELINGGGLTVSSGAAASGTNINFQGTEIVDSGAMAVGGTVVYGGNLYVSGGGSAVSVTLNSGDNFTVSSGGTAIATFLTDGAGINIAPGAIVSGTIVNSGAIDTLKTGATDTGTVLDAFGIEIVSGGGVSFDTMVGGGGWETISSGGVASDTNVAGAGVLVISSGGVAFSPNVAAGGEIIVLAGGAVSGAPTGAGSIVSAGDVVVAMGSGVISQGASFTGLSLQNQQTEYILSGGTTTGTEVFPGGIEYVDAGVASGTTLNSRTTQPTTIGPSQETVFSGGVAIGTTEDYLTVLGVKAGGFVSNVFDETAGAGAVFYYLSMGGSATDITISAGQEYIFGGATQTNTIVEGGGQGLDVFGGGMALNTTISSGGQVEVSEGGVMSNTTIAGGVLDLAAGGAGGQNFQGTASGTITFTGSGGALVLEDAPGMNATVLGFAPGDSFALVDSWPASATLGSGNVLTVSGNGNSYAIQLDPTQDYAGDTFNVTSGGVQHFYGDVADVTITEPGFVAPVFASGTIAPVSEYVHVGSPETVALTVSNIGPVGGSTENLLASLASVTGGLGIAAAGPTGEIAAGSNDTSSLQLGFSTSSAGTIAGTATVDLTSDGGTGSGSIDGLGTSALSPQTVPVSITVDNFANPVFEDVSGAGTFTPGTTAYALNLGTITQGTGPFAVNLGVLNNTAGPSDVLTGSLASGGSSAFINSGLASIGTLAAGQSDTAPEITLATGTTGTFSETITLTGTGSNPGGFAAVLPAETLTVTGTVVAGSGTVTVPPIPPAIATVLTSTSINFGAVHVLAEQFQSLDIGNTATTGAAALDASVQSVAGDANTSGNTNISGLAAGGTDSSINVGIASGVAGPGSGTVTLGFVSDAGTLGTTDLPAQNITVLGTFYREASAALLPLNVIAHVGDAGTISLPVANSDPADDFSENLIASLTGVTGGLGIAAAGPAADIAAGETNTSTLALSFATTQAGTVSGNATVGLVSDGTGIDGLGQTTLAAQVVPVSVTIDNYASAALTSTNPLLTETGANAYVLNFGTVTQGEPVAAVTLSELNAAAAPADGMDGIWSVNGGTGFTNTGFASFSTIGAGGSLTAGTIALGTSQTGTLTETLTLTPTDDNGAGFTLAQAPVTITVKAVIAPATAIGDVHMTTFDGLRYDFQAVGDFTLARSTNAGDPFDVQIQTAAYAPGGDVSVTTEVAARIGGDDIVFALGGGIDVNGVQTTLLAGQTQQFMDGSVTRDSGSVYAIDWSGGEALTVGNEGYCFNLAMTLGAGDGPGSVAGLLGSDSGQANDFALPDGTVLRQPLSAETILGTFADAWAVDANSSMLNGTTIAPLGVAGLDQPAFISATTPGEVLTGSLGAALSDATYAGTMADMAGDTLFGFAAGDAVDIADFTPAGSTLDFAGSGGNGVLTLAGAGGTTLLRVEGAATGVGFSLSADGRGGSRIQAV